MTVRVRQDAPDEEFICMIFSDTGNAVDAFDCTPEEFRRQSALWGSHATVEPSLFLAASWVQEEFRP